MGHFGEGVGDMDEGGVDFPSRQVGAIHHSKSGWVDLGTHSWRGDRLRAVEEEL